MNWSESITFEIPPQDARLLAKAPPQDWQDHVRGREETAYQRGRRDGERALGEKLLQQRNEIAELQRGIMTSLHGSVAQVIHDSEKALVELALQAAEKIFAGMPVTPEMVEAVVREA